VEEADVYGALEGSLESTTKVSIRSTGCVSGNVIYKKMSMEDGGELEGTFECSNRASGRLRNREGVPAEGLDRLLARNGEAADRGGGGGGAGAASSPAEQDGGRTSTPPREQSPLPWEHRQEQGDGGLGEAAAAAAVVLGGGDGGRGGTVASSAAGGGTPPPAGDAGSLSAGTSVGTLPPPPTPPTSADARPTPAAAAPVRLSSPLRSGGLQVQSLGAEAAEMFSAEAVTPTGGPSELPGGATGKGTGARQGRLPLKVGRGGGEHPGVGAEGSAPQEGGSSTSVAARVVTWPPVSPAPAGRLWHRRQEVRC
ncbi:unnamed protein product, partial [Hapterophycus canaliculatus]